MKKSFPFDEFLRIRRIFRNGGAFTIAETLTVIAIMSLLLALVGPAIPSLLGANGTTCAVDEVGGLIEQGRQTAMQTGRWVWLGMADTTALNHGEAQIAVVTVASRDGSSRIAKDNLIELSRSSRVRQVRISNTAQGGAEVLGSQPGGFSFAWDIPTDQGRREVKFSKFVLGFSPRGEAVTGTEDVPAWIRVVLQSPTNPRDKLSLLVSGPSGQVIVAR